MINVIKSRLNPHVTIRSTLSTFAALFIAQSVFALEVIEDGSEYKIKRSEITAAELALTSGALFDNARQSIRTLDNATVELVTPLRAENPDNVKRIESIMNEDDWNYLFPRAATEYSYEKLLKAAAKFPAVCGTYMDGRNSDAICAQSLATMFAHFAQETGGHNDYWPEPQWRQALYFVREMGWTEGAKGGYNADCAQTTQWQQEKWPCGKYEDGSYKSYFGRGAKQLSYNYNYGPFSEAMYGDASVLLNNPERVADTWLNLASALFFFVYPQPPKPSMLHVLDGTWVPNAHDQSLGIKPGFGATINIINGGLECGSGNEDPKAQNRADYYRQFAGYLGVPIAVDEELGCKNQKTFDTSGAGAMTIQWDQNWGYYADRPGAHSFECKLVGYQTAYSALVFSEYAQCVADFFKVTYIEDGTATPTPTISVTATLAPSPTGSVTPTVTITHAPSSVPNWILGQTDANIGEVYQYNGACWEAIHDPGVWEAPQEGWHWTEVACPVASTPTIEPTAEPTIAPTATATPTVEPTVELTTEPTATATMEPTIVPTATATPTVEPTVEVTTEPTATATMEPTVAPTATATPTAEPTVEVTTEPTATATMEPTIAPTATATPTVEPTAEVTTEPTVAPTVAPTTASAPTQTVTVGAFGGLSAFAVLFMLSLRGRRKTHG